MKSDAQQVLPVATKRLAVALQGCTVHMRNLDHHRVRETPIPPSRRAIEAT